MNGFHDGRNRPSSSTRVGTRSGGSVGAPSTSVRWTPMPRAGRFRRRGESRRAARSAGHQARAGENAVVVRVEDAVVDTDGQAEIICVDDEGASHGQLLG